MLDDDINANEEYEFEEDFFAKFETLISGEVALATIEVQCFFGIFLLEICYKSI